MSQQYSPNRTGTASSTPSSVERQARDWVYAANIHKIGLDDRAA